MRKLLLVGLICLIVPMQHAASAQQTPPSRILNDWCYPGETDFGWMTMCSIALIEGDGGRDILASGYSATWSPDGLRVAYTDGQLLYVLDRTNGSITTLDASSPDVAGSFMYEPVWSPDGAHIAFIENVFTFAGASQWNLVVVNADGSNRIRLNGDVRITGAFAWAPSGTAMAFPGDAGGLVDLYTVKVDGSSLARRTNNVGFGGAVTWSPDGGWIGFNCGTTICAIHPDGSSLVPLAPNAPYATSAAFSPANGSIAFVAAGELAVQSSAGVITLVAPGLRASTPRWSPDGTRLAFVQEGGSPGACDADGSPCASPDETFVVNRDGSGLRILGEGTRPVWFAPPAGHPIASFTVACAGAACQFDATSAFDPDGTIGDYAWRFGDGTTASGPSPAHTYATTGYYQVTLIITDNSGARDMTGAHVEANARPTASFAVTCAGPTCTFDGSPSSDRDGAIISYLWSFGDGSGRSSVESVASHVYKTGTYTASLFVYDNAFAVSDAVNRTLTIVNQLPVASLTVTCVHLRCTFDASSSSDADDGIYYREWTFGDGLNNGTGAQAGTYDYSKAGTYTITLTVFDFARQSTTTQRTVTVTAPPPPPPVSIHIGDLDSSTNKRPKNWDAVALIHVHTGAHGAAVGATITGSWDDGAAASCTTDTSGRCAVGKYDILNKASSVTFTVTSAAGVSFAYGAAANHDPDGDSTGTAVKIKRP